MVAVLNNIITLMWIKYGSYRKVQINFQVIYVCSSCQKSEYTENNHMDDCCDTKMVLLWCFNIRNIGKLNPKHLFCVFHYILKVSKPTEMSLEQQNTEKRRTPHVKSWHINRSRFDTGILIKFLCVSHFNLNPGGKASPQRDGDALEQQEETPIPLSVFDAFANETQQLLSKRH